MHWRAWGDAAFADAAAEGKLVFLSIGFSTCHWCHVMQRESFRDPAIAALLNDRFVSVKVDREERPDVDALYLQAVTALTGRGGWPMTLVLTADTREVVFAATYLPPRDGERGFTRGLATILDAVANDWDNHPENLRKQAEALSRHLTEQAAPAAPAGWPADFPRRVVDALLAEADPILGGFGDAPRFPRAPSLRQLAVDPRPAAKAHAALSVQRMADSAMRDRLGGGWHRYATDAAGQRPHFERMLADQALLIELLVDLAPHDPSADLLLDETLEALLRDFRLPSGLFASAIDAESVAVDGSRVEGAYTTWTAAELRDTLGDVDGSWVAERFHVGAGAVEGRDPLHAGDPLTPSDAARWREVRVRLLAARDRRQPPPRDDKVVTSWNGLTLAALSRASAVRPDVLPVAVTLAEAMSAALRPDGRVVRSTFAGEVGGPGTIDDVAAWTHGLLALHAATGEARWWTLAEQVHAELTRFEDPAGGWFLTAADVDDLPRRPRAAAEGAEPHAAALAAATDAWIAAGRGGDEALRARADRTFAAYAAAAAARPDAFPSFAEAWRHRARRWQLVVVRPTASADDRDLVAVAAGRDAWVFRVVDGAGAPLVVADKVAEGRATAYLCEDTRCLAPEVDARRLADAWTAADRAGGDIAR